MSRNLKPTDKQTLFSLEDEPPLKKIIPAFSQNKKKPKWQTPNPRARDCRRFLVDSYCSCFSISLPTIIDCLTTDSRSPAHRKSVITNDLFQIKLLFHSLSESYYSDIGPSPVSQRKAQVKRSSPPIKRTKSS